MKSKPDNKFAQKDFLLTQVQMENVRKLLDDLHSKRVEKIISLAQDKAKVDTIVVDSSMMLRHEKDLFENIYNKLLEHKKNTLANIFDMSKKPELPLEEEKPGKISQEGPVKDKKKVNETTIENEIKKIEFLQPVAKFFDADLNSYGPFEAGNSIELPEKIVNILLEKGAVKLI